MSGFELPLVFFVSSSILEFYRVFVNCIECSQVYSSVRYGYMVLEYSLLKLVQVFLSCF